jgi:FkbM family methyltransferase
MLNQYRMKKLARKIFRFIPLETLLTNISLNPSLEKNIVPCNIALGDKEGVVKMFSDCETNSGSNRMVGNHIKDQSKLTEVIVSTLDIFVSSLPVTTIDVIKIDVEGFEMNVLKGAEATLRKYKPILYIEVNNNNLQAQNSSAEELLTFIKDAGYDIFEIDTHQEIKLFSISRHTDVYCLKKAI